MIKSSIAFINETLNMLFLYDIHLDSNTPVLSLDSWKLLSIQNKIKLIISGLVLGLHRVDPRDTPISRLSPWGLHL